MMIRSITIVENECVQSLIMNPMSNDSDSYRIDDVTF